MAVYSSRVIDAFAFAFDLHKEQVRKGSGVPYVTHLMAVSASVGGHGGSEDQVIGGLLHDAAEDQGGHAVLERIRDRFGATVAEYVAACSDSLETPKPPWFERKQNYIASLRLKSPEIRMIVAADKLHNARSIISDLRSIGNEVWKRFQQGRDDTLWYYREVLDALSSDHWRHPILIELADAIDLMHRIAAQMQES